MTKLKNKGSVLGHGLAFFTIMVWGTSLVSTKAILTVLSPLQIIVYRSIVAYVILLVIHPRIKKPTDLKEEALYFLAGLSGINLYMFTQNIALSYSTASNVGLITSVAPILTAGLFLLFVREEKVNMPFVFGFMIAITGIFLVMFNGSVMLKINPFGDFLALVAALCWAIYSVILKKILSHHHHLIYSTRKIYFYGLISMIPFIFYYKIKFDFTVFKDTTILFNLLYLGVVSSAVCFMTWAKANALIGGVKTSTYIYLIPFVTIVASVIFLDETVTVMMVVGCIFILLGLYVSDKKTIFKKKN